MLSINALTKKLSTYKNFFVVALGQLNTLQSLVKILFKAFFAKLKLQCNFLTFLRAKVLAYNHQAKSLKIALLFELTLSIAVLDGR